MAINPKYVLASGLEEYFVDHATGLPLKNGILKFYSDVNRSTPKNVFTISGTPPNYNYVNLGSTINLNATGNPVDEDGNSIVIYYYPYDVDGNVELYYITCESEGEISSYTREAWPNSFVDDFTVQQTDNIPNFIPNGQFKLHNNLPYDAVNNIPAGKIRSGDTLLAPPNWVYEIPNHTLSTDYLSFFRYGEYVTNPTASPRYACRIQCLGANPAVAYKSFYIQFDDANKFSSDTQQYTFSFTGITFESSDVTVECYLQKYYGSGGSPSPIDTIFLTNFTITNTSQIFQHSFVFGSNAGKEVGTNDDDDLKIILGFPTGISFGVEVTDFVLVEGPVNIVTFPQTTDEDFIARSMIPPLPSPDGADLYLPIVATPTGYDYDRSNIGKVYTTIYATPQIGELLCDGASYRTSGYSTDGIPYSRLHAKMILAPNSELPIFGTGVDYVSSSSFHTGTTEISLTTNKAGSQTTINDGAVPTGFTFSTVRAGTTTLGFSCFLYGAGDRLWIRNDVGGHPFESNGAGTSGFTVHMVPLSQDGEVAGTSVAHQILSVIVTAVPAAGTYFYVSSQSAAYYVWFRINGVGVDPAVADYTSLRVDLLSTMDKYDVAYAIACALSAYQVNTITTTPGSSITPNSYFNYYANGTHYYAWMSVNGGGTDPALPTSIGVQVTYQTTYSATQVRAAVISAINALYFAVPDLRGCTVKGWDPTGAIDLNSQYRYSMNKYQTTPVSLPYYIGSKQFGVLLSHQHNTLKYDVTVPTDRQVEYQAADYAEPLSVDDATLRFLIEATGTAQNDVDNVYLNYVIKY